MPWLDKNCCWYRKVGDGRWKEGCRSMQVAQRTLTWLLAFFCEVGFIQSTCCPTKYSQIRYVKSERFFGTLLRVAHHFTKWFRNHFVRRQECWPTKMQEIDSSYCVGTLMQAPHFDIWLYSKPSTFFVESWRPQKGSHNQTFKGQNSGSVPVNPNGGSF